MLLDVPFSRLLLLGKERVRALFAGSETGLGWLRVGTVGAGQRWCDSLGPCTEYRLPGRLRNHTWWYPDLWFGFVILLHSFGLRSVGNTLTENVRLLFLGLCVLSHSICFYEYPKLGHSPAIIEVRKDTVPSYCKGICDGIGSSTV